MKIFLEFLYQDIKKDGFQKNKVNQNQERVFQKKNCRIKNSLQNNKMKKKVKKKKKKKYRKSQEVEVEATRNIKNIINIILIMENDT